MPAIYFFFELSANKNSLKPHVYDAVLPVLQVAVVVVARSHADGHLKFVELLRAIPSRPPTNIKMKKVI